MIYTVGLVVVANRLIFPGKWSLEQAGRLFSERENCGYWGKQISLSSTGGFQWIPVGNRPFQLFNMLFCVPSRPTNTQSVSDESYLNISKERGALQQGEDQKVKQIFNPHFMSNTFRAQLTSLSDILL